MFADDRVLVGVVKRVKDYDIIRNDHWYRIPQRQMPDGINAEYIAFFLSRSAFRQGGGAVASFARITGIELARRTDLLPGEDQRSADIYYRVQFRKLVDKDPPIANASRRSISFIRTTWDRFIAATTIPDLYSRAEFYVDRVYYALGN